MSAGWPFETVVSGNPASGGRCAIQVAGATTEDNVKMRDQYHLAVASFADLANYGGLAGDILSPQASCARPAPAKPESPSPALTWRLEQMAIDPRALSVLLNMLEGCDLPPRFVTVVAHDAGQTITLAPDAYPPMTPQIPFALEYDVTTRNMDLEIVFPRPVSGEKSERIIDALLAWRLVGFLGGFRRPELHPLESNFFPAEEPETIEDTIVMSIEKMTLDVAAFDSLVNTLVWIDSMITPIEQASLT
jgi:hypothetical protein